MPGSLSQISRRGTRPSCRISSHEPSNKSSVFRVGIIRPVMNRECAAVITNTGSSLAVPSSSGIFRGGNHKSHWAASPAAHDSRSAGSIRRCSGRSSFTFSLNHRIEPVQPTRSASTVAGMSGVSSNSARTRGSNTTNDVGPEDRSYLGGPAEFTALITVVREIPSRSAIRAFGTPSAASLLINAQSSKVITLPSLSAHFSPPKLFSFRAPSTLRVISGCADCAAKRRGGQFGGDGVDVDVPMQPRYYREELIHREPPSPPRRSRLALSTSVSGRGVGTVAELRVHANQDTFNIGHGHLAPCGAGGGQPRSTTCAKRFDPCLAEAVSRHADIIETWTSSRWL